MKYAPHLMDAVESAMAAGAAVMEVYESDFAVETKKDRSPLTLADRKSHEIIAAGLKHHGIPMISEEGRELAYDLRSRWPVLWMVDPLDGTKEFVKRNGEFTVNIALIEDQMPVLGVVYAPVNGWLYFAADDIGAFKQTGLQAVEVDHDESLSAGDRVAALIRRASRLPLDGPGRDTYTIVGSRSHGSPELEAFVEQKKKEKGRVEFLVAGSSLKICLVAEGSADIYPRLGPTMEWDTAAGQAIATCSGARVYVHVSGEELKYNRKDMLNPWFVVER